MNAPPYFENQQKTWFVVMRRDSGITDEHGNIKERFSYPLMIYPSRERAEMVARPDCFVVEVKPL